MTGTRRIGGHLTAVRDFRPTELPATWDDADGRGSTGPRPAAHRYARRTPR